MKRQRKGFTLVELAIVIAILGILAVVAIPKYQGMVDEARSSAAKAQLGTVRSAIAISYAKNHGKFPNQTGSPDVFSTASSTIFADGGTPSVEITKADGTVLSSANVATSTANPISVSGSTGGWIYNSTTGEVRINSSDPDPATSQTWSSY